MIVKTGWNHRIYGEAEIKSVNDLEMYPYSISFMLDQMITNSEFISIIRNVADVIRLAELSPQHKEQIFSALLNASTKDFIRIIGTDDYFGYQLFDARYPDMKEKVLNRIYNNPEEYHQIFYTYHSNKSAFFKQDFSYMHNINVQAFNKELSEKHPGLKDKLGYSHDVAVAYRRNSIS